MDRRRLRGPKKVRKNALQPAPVLWFSLPENRTFSLLNVVFFAGVLRGNTMRGNTTRNSGRKMALWEGLWEGFWQTSENLWKPLKTSETFPLRNPLRDPLRGRFPSQNLSVLLPLIVLLLETSASVFWSVQRAVLTRGSKRTDGVFCWATRPKDSRNAYKTRENPNKTTTGLIARAALDTCLDSPLLCRPLGSRFAFHGLRAHIIVKRETDFYPVRVLGGGVLSLWGWQTAAQYSIKILHPWQLCTG